jgi:hypothetical protein
MDDRCGEKHKEAVDNFKKAPELKTGVWTKHYRIKMPGPALVGEFAAWMRESLLDGDLATPGPTKKHRVTKVGGYSHGGIPQTGPSGTRRGMREEGKMSSAS